jgi:Zn-finger nucleic acid-binding protein
VTAVARTRRCPICRVDLQPLTYGGVTLDVCLQCCGIWFDAEELERLLELPGPVFHTSRLQYTGSEPTRRLCPACGATIRAQEIHPGGSVCDRCPDCGGLWLDFNAIRLLREEVVGPDDDHKLLEQLKDQVRRALLAAQATWEDRRDEQTRQAMEALTRAGGFPGPESSVPTVWQLLEEWAREHESAGKSQTSAATESTVGAAAKGAAWWAAETFAPFPLGVLLGLARTILEVSGLGSDDAPACAEHGHRSPDRGEH